MIVILMNYIIIKEGKVSEPSKWTRELTCTTCGCIFKAKIDNTFYRLTLYGNIELVSCPTCKKAVTVTVNDGVD